MSNIDKRALREAAERATESDWIVDAHEGWHAVIPVADAVNGNYIIAEFQGPESKRNRDFVAAANPVTVLALLDELEAKDKQVAELQARDQPKFVQCWSCKRAIEVLAIADCDGYCPRCAAPIDLDDEPYAAGIGKGE